ncbi:MAG: hypothetical protein JW827_12745 [Spirochaetes bacterium]|nr:hypothetical protein [Spirochaetota bacterium]
MLLRWIRLYIFICLFLVSDLVAREHVWKNFIFTYPDDVPQEKIERVIRILDDAQDFFKEKFSFAPFENVTLKISGSVNDFTSALRVPYWVGGWYQERTIYLQPLDVLIKKNVLKKIIFTEYAHFYFESYTFFECPGWFNEMLAVTYFYDYSHEPLPLFQKSKLLEQFEDFIDLKRNLRSKNYTKDFFLHAIHFTHFLSQTYGEHFIRDILKAMHQGNSFSNVIKKKTGRSIKDIYEKDFM